MHIKICVCIILITLSYSLLAQTLWEKYDDNPVFGKEDTTYWVHWLRSPVVIYDDYLLKMWISGKAVGVPSQIGYGESDDGIEWELSEDPVVPSGDPGEWDRHKDPGCVIRINDTLKMWFSGSSDGFQLNSSIGYAWSVGDNEWNVYSDPVMEHSDPGWWDETGVIHPKVHFDGNTYHMWYHGWGGLGLYDPGMIGYATSTNGIDWNKYILNPVLNLGPPGSFYYTWVLPSCVMFHDNEYKMWFTGWDGFDPSPMRYFRSGYATSPNGTDWTVQNNLQPVLDVGEPDDWDARAARAPSVLIHEGQYMMWYEGDGYDLDWPNIGFADGGYVGFLDKLLSDEEEIHVSPNPFSGEVTITCRITEKTDISLDLYDLLGVSVVNLDRGIRAAGEYRLNFDGSNLPIGIYFCVMKAGEYTRTLKIVKTE